MSHQLFRLHLKSVNKSGRNEFLRQSGLLNSKLWFGVRNAATDFPYNKLKYTNELNTVPTEYPIPVLGDHYLKNYFVNTTKSQTQFLKNNGHFAESRNELVANEYDVNLDFLVSEEHQCFADCKQENGQTKWNTSSTHFLKYFIEKNSFRLREPVLHNHHKNCFLQSHFEGLRSEFCYHSKKYCPSFGNMLPKIVDPTTQLYQTGRVKQTICSVEAEFGKIRLFAHGKSLDINGRNWKLEKNVDPNNEAVDTNNEVLDTNNEVLDLDGGYEISKAEIIYPFMPIEGPVIEIGNDPDEEGDEDLDESDCEMDEDLDESDTEMDEDENPDEENHPNEDPDEENDPYEENEPDEEGDEGSDESDYDMDEEPDSGLGDSGIDIQSDFLDM